MTPAERARRFVDVLLEPTVLGGALSGLQLSIPEVRGAIEDCVAAEIEAAIIEDRAARATRERRGA